MTAAVSYSARASEHRKAATKALRRLVFLIRQAETTGTTFAWRQVAICLRERVCRENEFWLCRSFEEVANG